LRQIDRLAGVYLHRGDELSYVCEQDYRLRYARELSFVWTQVAEALPPRFHLPAFRDRQALHRPLYYLAGLVNYVSNEVPIADPAPAVFLARTPPSFSFFEKHAAHPHPVHQSLHPLVLTGSVVLNLLAL
jgi:hypothetical protein